MSDRYLAEPDLGFINEVVGLGGDSLKKCYQCATCAVACPIAPDKKPFPRKEMLAASWGLKDKLVGNADIWLCHECGDCSDLCPRDAKPGEVLSAVRSYAITEYATPKSLGKIVNNSKMLLLLLVVPGLWFGLMAYITMAHGKTMDKIFHAVNEMIPIGMLQKFHWYHGPHGDGAPIAHAQFISTWLVDFTFVPLSLAVAVILALGLKKFLTDIHANAVIEGKAEKTDFSVMDVFTPNFLKAFVNVVITILKHQKFNECSENSDRATPHMMLLFGFIGCAIVTGVCVLLLYGLNMPGPYPQMFLKFIPNPLKALANVAGMAIIIGSGLLIKNRLDKTDGTTSYKDWYLLAVVFIIGVTGMLAEMTRIGMPGMPAITFAIYWAHLVAVFNLFAFLPFSKMAHFVYRTVAMAYAEYVGR